MDELNADPDLRLRWYVGDTPERRTVKGMVSHQGYHGCELCLARGEYKNGLWWPSTTAGAPLRTNLFMRTMARYCLEKCLELNWNKFLSCSRIHYTPQTVTKEERKGVTGSSPLARLP